MYQVEDYYDFNSYSSGSSQRDLDTTNGAETHWTRVFLTIKES